MYEKIQILSLKKEIESIQRYELSDIDVLTEINSEVYNNINYFLQCFA